MYHKTNDVGKTDNIDLERECIVKPQVKIINCPIRTSLGVLGKKWTMLIIRDIGFLKINRFNRILESIPGLTPRVLSMRLRELEKEEIIRCTQIKSEQTMVLWNLTEKGKDILPILLMLTAYGSKWYSEHVFEDKKPRRLDEVFLLPETMEQIVEYNKRLNFDRPFSSKRL
ncbi:winged helix-turn-helix transcriptional regulator [Candidatus Nitrosocosmicus hydrocola]|uniref:winged helix-turn-helix transcriptional regulator n=1 Tax=Candidatus Nitrosocosmicus hydrocola TaxID=1826872 RepID=UPI0011E5BE01|nr:helix-turn-helix domain-containing protein [Candidatus Nitrosocosmicus hydrocola]